MKKLRWVAIWGAWLSPKHSLQNWVYRDISREVIFKYYSWMTTWIWRKNIQVIISQKIFCLWKKKKKKKNRFLGPTGKDPGSGGQF